MCGLLKCRLEWNVCSVADIPSYLCILVSKSTCFDVVLTDNTIDGSDHGSIITGTYINIISSGVNEILRARVLNTLNRKVKNNLK